MSPSEIEKQKDEERIKKEVEEALNTTPEVALNQQDVSKALSEEQMKHIEIVLERGILLGYKAEVRKEALRQLHATVMQRVTRRIREGRIEIPPYPQRSWGLFFKDVAWKIGLIRDNGVWIVDEVYENARLVAQIAGGLAVAGAGVGAVASMGYGFGASVASAVTPAFSAVSSATGAVVSAVATVPVATVAVGAIAVGVTANHIRNRYKQNQ